MDYAQLKALIEQRGVHDVFGGSGETDWFIEQNPHELATFLVEMQKLGVTSILEIGTGWRAGLARFLHDDMGWRVTSVDIKNYGHAFSGIAFVHPDDFTYDTAFGVPAEQFDLVLLDADHTYDGVKDQHEFYAPYATKVIAFHDIAGLRDCEGVAKYWEEAAFEGSAIKDGYYQIFDGMSDQRGGIGYIVLAEAKNTAVHTTGTPSVLVDPESIGSVTHEMPSPAKPKPSRKPAAKKPAAKPTAKKPAVKK